MRLFVAEEKVAQVRQLSKNELLLSQLNRRGISISLLCHFCVVYISLSLALSLSRRSFFFDMAGVKDSERRKTSERNAEGGACETQALPRGPQREVHRGACRPKPPFVGRLSPIEICASSFYSPGGREERSSLLAPT